MSDIFPVKPVRRDTKIKELVLQVATLVEQRKFAQALFTLSILQGQLLIATFKPHPNIIRLTDDPDDGPGEVQ